MTRLVQNIPTQIARVTIILDKRIVSGLKGNPLLDQIKVFKEAGAPNLQGAIPKFDFEGIDSDTSDNDAE